MFNTLGLPECLPNTSEVHEAVVVAVLQDGAVEVRLRTELRIIVCNYLDTGSGCPVVQDGETVVCLLMGEGSKRGYLLGVVRAMPKLDRSGGRSNIAKPIPSRLVLEANEEVVIKTAQSKIAIRANGDVEVLGRRIISRARKSQKLLAPMLKLN